MISEQAEASATLAGLCSAGALRLPWVPHILSSFVWGLRSLDIDHLSLPTNYVHSERVTKPLDI